MIKRILGFGVLTGFLVVSVVALAQESTSSSKNKETTSTASGKVLELKEKLATKVAELREKQKRGIYGEIAALSKTSFTLVTLTGEVKVRYGEDTQVFDETAKKTEKATSDLKNSQYASVLGYYDDSEEQQHAKVILIQKLPTHISGEIKAIDKEAGVVTLKTDKGETKIDYEKTTKSDEYVSSEQKLKKSGLSRFGVGDRIHVWVTGTEDDPQKLSAVRILRLPKELFAENLGANQVATPSAATTSASASPSASPKKITPRSTPKSTPRPSSKASPKTSPVASTEP